MAFLRSEPDIGLHDVFRKMPDQARGIISHYEGLMRGRSELSPGERELVYAFCCSLADASLPYRAHRVAARELGIDDGLIDSIVADFETASLTPKLRAILAFAHTLTETPQAVNRDLVERILRTGYTEQAVIDTVCVTAIAAWISRIVLGLGLSAPNQEVSDMRGKALAQHGYLPVSEQLRTHEPTHEADGQSTRGT